MSRPSGHALQRMQREQRATIRRSPARWVETESSARSSTVVLLKAVAATLEGHAADPGPFLLRLEAFTEIPADADRLRRETTAHESEARRLREDTTKLDPPGGTLDELACRPLPEGERIEAARVAFTAIDEDENHRICKMQDDVADFEREVAKLVETVTPDLADRPARDALDQITMRLTPARRARDQRETLLEAAKKRAASRAALVPKRVRSR